jgi:formylglycine-generating enzyme
MKQRLTAQSDLVINMNVAVKLLTLLFILTIMITFSVSFAQESVPVQVVLDEDSLTLYVEPSGIVSLAGLGITVDIDGSRQTFFLEQFGAFAVLDFTQLPTPLCFRLERFDSDSPFPLNCPSQNTLLQTLAQSDIFWFDERSRQSRTLVIVQGQPQQAICPAGQAVCNFAYVAPVGTSIPSPTVISPNVSDLDAAISQASTFDYRRGNNTWSPISFMFDDGVTMQLVPAGCFLMGSQRGQEDELPVHQQCIETPFWIDRTEVTQSDFERLEGSKASESKFVGNLRPVEMITWFEAYDFCTTIRGGRLLTEREWEYAARGPDNWLYPWGNEWQLNRVWYAGNSQGQTIDVGSFTSNASWVGALDMVGNVWEWVSTQYFLYPYSLSLETTEGIASTLDLQRVLRGGAYGILGETYLTTTNRHVDGSSTWWSGVGFRCARDA